jgi:hypothetical protein
MRRCRTTREIAREESRNRLVAALDSNSPESLEDCFLLDRGNECCWAPLQSILEELLGFYTINLANSQGDLKVWYTYAKPSSFFSYGKLDQAFLGDFSDRRVRVKRAIQKVPEVIGNGTYNTREEEIRANMYQLRGSPIKVLTDPERNAHTLACNWRAPALVQDESSPLRNMKVYFCLDWDSLDGEYPPPDLDEEKLYVALEIGRGAISIALRYWLDQNTDIPLIP